MIPSVAVVHLNFPHGPNFRLWLPLFLLWIPAVLLAPFALVILLVVCLALGIPFWRSIATFWAILCSVRGTDVRVATEGNRILVRVL
jgi:hypothetical protein